MSLKIHKKQKGYLLVHAAELLVGISLLGIAAVHGQDWWQGSKRDSFYHSLKDLETLIWEYRESNGRWPGDCNNNQMIEGLVVSIGEAVQIRGSNGGLDLGDYSCALNSASENSSHFVSELRLFKPDIYYGDFGDKLEYSDSISFQAGTLLIDDVNQTNAIIADGVSEDLAEWLELKVDGEAEADSQNANYSGRIRFWNQPQGDGVIFTYLFNSEIL